MGTNAKDAVMSGFQEIRKKNPECVPNVKARIGINQEKNIIDILSA
jgi:hypothetical protein